MSCVRAPQLSANPDGTYDLHYDDDDEEFSVPPRYVRPMGDAGTGVMLPSAIPEAPEKRASKPGG